MLHPIMVMGARRMLHIMSVMEMTMHDMLTIAMFILKQRIDDRHDDAIVMMMRHNHMRQHQNVCARQHQYSNPPFHRHKGSGIIPFRHTR